MKNENVTNQVFISHVRKDKEIAHALAMELEAKGFNVWTDENISVGADWSEEINAALERSSYMIAILSEYSFSSSYVRNELEHAFFSDRYKNRLLPVLIDPTSDTDFKRLPWILGKMSMLRITGKQSTESILNTIMDNFLALANNSEDS